MPWSKVLIEKEEKGFSHFQKEGKRTLSYVDALREAFDQALSLDRNVFIMGQGVDDATCMFGATKGLQKKYGKVRVFDVPLSENALTGIAIGAALSGMRPIYLHNRPDFLLLAMDQIINHASKWSYMFGGNANVPLLIWAPVGRGWGTAAQHSQALQGLFMHIPGLKLIMPSTPYDVKGLILSSIKDNNPVVIIDHRWLFKHTGFVPEDIYCIPFGKGVLRKQGKDVTVVAVSYMVIEALRAAEELQKEGIDVEVVDLRTLKPLDEKIILDSIKKTGRLLVLDTGWKTGGISAEIVSLVCEKGFNFLKKPPSRIASPDVPTPATYILEAKFYPKAQDIIKEIKELLK